MPTNHCKQGENGCGPTTTNFVVPLHTHQHGKPFSVAALQHQVNQYTGSLAVNSVTVRSEVDGNHEVKALRYAAGYVPRAIQHKLQTQNMSPLKEQLLLCMYDLLDDGDEESVPSAEWIDLRNRGGLTHVNELTFQVFLAMELEFRKHLSAQKTPNFKTDVSTKLKQNEDVQFYWSTVSGDWDETVSEELLEEIVKLFTTIRGFSYASAWVEKYKTANAKTLEKSKGL